MPLTSRKFGTKFKSKVALEVLKEHKSFFGGG